MLSIPLEILEYKTKNDVVVRFFFAVKMEFC